MYHSVLAAIADGNPTRGGIANYIGRKAADISHPLAVLEDFALVVREPDAFRAGRAQYRIVEPLVVFYQAVMRPQWRRLELGHAGVVWREARQRFRAQVVGPHFEALCRDHALQAGGELFGIEPAEVLAGTVADPANRTQIEVDVVVLAPAAAGEPRRIIALGEAKWGDTLDRRQLDRLRRVRDLLAVKGYDTRETVLVGYGGAGADPAWKSGSAGDRVLLIGLDQLYAKA